MQVISSHLASFEKSIVNESLMQLSLKAIAVFYTVVFQAPYEVYFPHVSFTAWRVFVSSSQCVQEPLLRQD